MGIYPYEVPFVEKSHFSPKKSHLKRSKVGGQKVVVVSKKCSKRVVVLKYKVQSGK